MVAPDRRPPDLPPGELLQRLMQTPRPFKVVPFPRRDPMTRETFGEVAIWPLTQAELMSARAAAEQYAKSRYGDGKAPRAGEDNPGFSAIFHDACTVELLVRACRDPKDLKSPAFPTAKLLREHVSANEITVLVRLYLQIEREVGPLVDLMSNEEMNAWIRRLQEEGSRIPLAFLSSEQLEDLLMHLVSLLPRSPTGSSSSGAPPSSGSPGSDDPAPDVQPDAPPDVDADPPAPEPEPEP